MINAATEALIDVDFGGLSSRALACQMAEKVLRAALDGWQLRERG
jgi:hypothetical protein